MESLTQMARIKGVIPIRGPNASAGPRNACAFMGLQTHQMHAFFQIRSLVRKARQCSAQAPLYQEAGERGERGCGGVSAVCDIYNPTEHTGVGGGLELSDCVQLASQFGL